MGLLKKFALGGKHYLSVGLNGSLPEIRISSFGSSTLVLTASEFDILLREGRNLLQTPMEMSSAPGFFGGTSHRKCLPDESTGGLKFLTQLFPDAQPLDFTELEHVEYILPQNSARVFVDQLPKAKACVDSIMDSQASISLAYTVVEEQMKRLVNANGGLTSVEFFFIHRLLQQYIPLSFLMSDFKKRSPGTTLNLFDLFRNILCQTEYLHAMS